MMHIEQDENKKLSVSKMSLVTFLLCFLQTVNKSLFKIQTSASYHTVRLQSQLMLF